MTLHKEIKKKLYPGPVEETPSQCENRTDVDARHSSNNVMQHTRRKLEMRRIKNIVA